MGSKAELRYEFSNAKSLKIYPKTNREPISAIALSSPVRIVRRALNASEKEVSHLMSVANRRLDRIIKMNTEKESSLEKIVTENVKAGVHLADEIFIPEYLGFMEIQPEGVDEVRIYARDGHSMTRMNEGWLLVLSGGSKILLSIPNMQVAITVLGSLGLDINFEDYLSGSYDSSRKTLHQSTFDIISGILKDREGSSQNKIG